MTARSLRPLMRQRSPRNPQHGGYVGVPAPAVTQLWELKPAPYIYSPHFSSHSVSFTLHHNQALLRGDEGKNVHCHLSKLSHAPLAPQTAQPWPVLPSAVGALTWQNTRRAVFTHSTAISIISASPTPLFPPLPAPRPQETF